MPTFRIPEDDYSSILTLARLNGQQLESLAKAIEQTKPDTSADFVAQVAQKSGIDEKEAKGILEILLTLYSIRDGRSISLDEFVDDVCSSVFSIEELKLSDAEKDRFASGIKLLLTFDATLGVVAKAQNLAVEYDKVFCGARIMSDIRPLFAGSPGDTAGALIIHSLNISYHEGRSYKEFYVALDCDELEDLKQVIERAEKKAVSLKRLLKNSSIPHLGWHSADEP